MGKQYQVVGAAALVTQQTVNGPMKSLLYAGHVLGPGYTEAEIAHNVAGGLIREIGGDDDLIAAIEFGANHPRSQVLTAEHPVADTGETVETGETVVDDSQPIANETDADRAAAKAKLPTDGSAPKANAAQAVWVEYAVAKGYGFDASKGATRDELIKLTSQ
jgi:hypothetical protein